MTNPPPEGAVPRSQARVSHDSRTRTRRRRWSGLARARHEQEGESWVAADSSATAKKRRLPNAQARGQSQMSTDARGGSSRDFTEIATAQRLRGSKRLLCADGMRSDQGDWSIVALPW